MWFPTMWGLSMRSRDWDTLRQTPATLIEKNSILTEATAWATTAGTPGHFLQIPCQLTESLNWHFTPIVHVCLLSLQFMLHYSVLCRPSHSLHEGFCTPEINERKETKYWRGEWNKALSDFWKMSRQPGLKYLPALVIAYSSSLLSKKN